MELSGHASQSSIYTTIIAFSVLSVVIVFLRLITRLAIVRQSGWDDVFISIACVASVVMGVSISKQANYGMGLHIDTVSEEDIHTAFEWFWVFLWLYYTALCFTKLSILLQYLRVFQTRTFTYCCWALIIVVTLWSAWTIFSSIFTCLPVARFWTDLGWAAQGCLPRLTLWYVNAAVNIATDCATALLPLPVINSLEIPKRQKTILMCVFAAGLFTCFISILRLVYIYPLTVSPDFTWHSPLPTIWSCVEVNVAIICSCVPTLKGFVQRFFPKLLSMSHSLPRMKDSKDSAATASTEDSMIKSDVDVMERSLSPTWYNGRRFSNIGGPKKVGRVLSTSYWGDKRSVSEESILEFTTLSSHSSPISVDRSVTVQIADYEGQYDSFPRQS